MPTPFLPVLLRVAADDAEQWPDQHPKNTQGQALATIHPEMLRQAADEIEACRTRTTILEAATVDPWTAEEAPTGTHPSTSKTEKRSPGGGDIESGGPAIAVPPSVGPTSLSDERPSLPDRRHCSCWCHVPTRTGGMLIDYHVSACCIPEGTA